MTSNQTAGNHTSGGNITDEDLVPEYPPAPPWQTTEWFNTKEPLTLESLRGRVVLLHAFQMLCPGCVQQSLPQAQRVARMFRPESVAVVGLHTVFEHHDAMTPAALKAFIHEYRLTFPIGIDAPLANSLTPATMTAYRMQGTPTAVLIDREGRIRKQSFGAEPDMQVGADIAFLLAGD